MRAPHFHPAGVASAARNYEAPLTPSCCGCRLVELGDGIVIDDMMEPRLSGDNTLVLVCDDRSVTGMDFMNPVLSRWILDSISHFKPLLPITDFPDYLTANKGGGQKRKAR